MITTMMNLINKFPLTLLLQALKTEQLSQFSLKTLLWKPSQEDQNPFQSVPT